jgi:beta-glucosidase
MKCMWMGKRGFLDAEGNFSPAKAAEVLPLGIGQVGRPSDTIGTARQRKTTFRSVEDTVALVNGIQRFLVEKTRLGIPALFHEETAHGLAAGGATIFPTPPALASTWDPPLVERAFAVAAREGRVRGATVALSPVLDLARDPRFGRVDEFFGEDPYLVGKMGAASVRGQQGSRPLGKDKLFVTLKHLVHGAPEGGLNLAPADVSERTLRSVFLPPFIEVIGATDPAIAMPSYNEIQGVPSHANRELLQRTVRERLGFKGAYFSDYGGIGMLAAGHGMAANDAEAAVLALEAGVDADLPDGEAYAKLPELVKAGRVSEAKIDAAVARILALKFEAGLFENPYVDAGRAVAQTNTAADIQLARKVAQKSIVLLKNDGILPLDPNAKLKLAVIGPNGVEPLFGGYSGVNPKAVGVLAGIRAAAGPNMTIEQADGVWIVGPEPTGEHRVAQAIRHVPEADNAKRIAEAIEVAKRADVILLAVGDQPEVTREAISRFSPGDRNSLGLFGDQDELVEAMIATGKPIIGLLINGRPLAVNRLAEKTNALIEGWYLGQEGGNAFADVLFGKVNPGGKLPVSFARSVGDLPVYYNRHPTSDRNIYIEGARKPLFPFGYGLSYTTFEISEPRLTKPQIAVGETAVVEVQVTNTGKRLGDEVVQLYIRDEVSSAPRPVLELRGFERVTLKPGETRTIRFGLAPDALAFWDIDMNWRVEPGTFTVSVGPSSAVLKSTKLQVVA